MMRVLMIDMNEEETNLELMNIMEQVSPSQSQNRLPSSPLSSSPWLQQRSRTGASASRSVRDHETPTPRSRMTFVIPSSEGSVSLQSGVLRTLSPTLASTPGREHNMASTALRSLLQPWRAGDSGSDQNQETPPSVSSRISKPRRDHEPFSPNSMSVVVPAVVTSYGVSSQPCVLRAPTPMLTSKASIRANPPYNSFRASATSQSTMDSQWLPTQRQLPTCANQPTTSHSIVSELETRLSKKQRLSSPSLHVNSSCDRQGASPSSCSLNPITPGKLFPYFFVGHI